MGYLNIYLDICIDRFPMWETKVSHDATLTSIRLLPGHEGGNMKVMEGRVIKLCKVRQVDNLSL